MTVTVTGRAVAADILLRRALHVLHCSAGVLGRLCVPCEEDEGADGEEGGGCACKGRPREQGANEVRAGLRRKRGHAHVPSEPCERCSLVGGVYSHLPSRCCCCCCSLRHPCACRMPLPTDRTARPVLVVILAYPVRAGVRLSVNAIPVTVSAEGRRERATDACDPFSIRRVVFPEQGRAGNGNGAREGEAHSTVTKSQDNGHDHDRAQSLILAVPLAAPSRLPLSLGTRTRRVRCHV